MDHSTARITCLNFFDFPCTASSLLSLTLGPILIPLLCHVASFALCGFDQLYKDKLPLHLTLLLYDAFVTSSVSVALAWILLHYLLLLPLLLHHSFDQLIDDKKHHSPALHLILLWHDMLRITHLYCFWSSFHEMHFSASSHSLALGGIILPICIDLFATM